MKKKSLWAHFLEVCKEDQTWLIMIVNISIAAYFTMRVCGIEEISYAIRGVAGTLLVIIITNLLIAAYNKFGD